MKWGRKKEKFIGRFWTVVLLNCGNLSFDIFLKQEDVKKRKVRKESGVVSRLQN